MIGTTNLWLGLPSNTLVPPQGFKFLMEQGEWLIAERLTKNPHRRGPRYYVHVEKDRVVKLSRRKAANKRDVQRTKNNPWGGFKVGQVFMDEWQTITFPSTGEVP